MRCGTRPAPTASRSAPSDVGTRHKTTYYAPLVDVHVIVAGLLLSSLDRVAGAIAHRGGSKLRPENTLAAFDHARRARRRRLECDVHLSRDGEPVVIHDRDARSDDGRDRPGVAPARPTSSARVDAGVRFGAGRRVSVPRRAASACRGSPTCSTGYRRAADRRRDQGRRRRRSAERSLGVIRDAGAAEPRDLRRLQPRSCSSACAGSRRDMPTSASRDEARSRAAPVGDSAGARGRRGFRLFQVPFRLARPADASVAVFVRAARRAGLPVQAWIVDEADDMRRLIDWGVTGIISDRPDRARGG